MAQLEYYRDKKAPTMQRSSSQSSLPACDLNRPKSSLSRMKKFSSQLSLANKPMAPRTDVQATQRPTFSGLSMANINKLIESKSQSITNGIEANFNRVLARGFPWDVEKSDVLTFFKGIKIPNGEKSIHIQKKKAMEAYIDVATDVDHDNALSRSGRLVGSHKIFGKRTNIEYIL